ncbi:MAG: glycosyltransferase family 2 protein, partial [Burkholderiales bacterium]|nr:glycosyltransferase family 2 protein [Anaerolineae bacterium]
NDGGTIASLIIEAMVVVEAFTDDYEIIVVNDGSADYTPDVLDRLARDYERVRVIHHAKNRGYGGALRSGFAAASKDLIFYTDGDAQYDVRDLRRLVPLMTPDVDFVQGYKLNRSDPFYRGPLGRLYHFAVNRWFRLNVRDVDCDFRLMRRRIFDQVELTHNSGVICVELIKKVQNCGFKVAEVGVNHYARPYGRSQFFRISHIVRTIKELVGLWRELMLPNVALPQPSNSLRPNTDAAQIP